MSFYEKMFGVKKFNLLEQARLLKQQQDIQQQASEILANQGKTLAGLKFEFKETGEMDAQCYFHKKAQDGPRFLANLIFYISNPNNNIVEICRKTLDALSESNPEEATNCKRTIEILDDLTNLYSSKAVVCPTDVLREKMI